MTLLRNRAFIQEIINRIHDRYQNIPPPFSSNAWIDSMINKNKSPFSPEDQTASAFEFKNALLAFRKDFSNMDWGYDKLLKMEIELIALIEKEYHN